MTENTNRFIQLHLLVSYPPSNPNRDELGQPKVATFGDSQRSRIASQSLKRAWRTSEIWEKQGLNIGLRSRAIGINLATYLINKLPQDNIDKKAIKSAVEKVQQILSLFVKSESLEKIPEKLVRVKGIAEFDGEDFINIQEILVGEKIHLKQPIHFSNEELSNIKKFLDNDGAIENILSENANDIDLAMFGRMIANCPNANSDAAVQVAHAISINAVDIEPDFFTAVDDLNKHGSAHMGEQEFVSAIYYLYLCIDTQLLLENLNDKVLAARAIKALTETAAVIAPTGKQNSYANRAQAFYILAEKGDAQPRNLSLAFLKALSTAEPESAIEKLRSIKDKFNTAYSKPAEKEMNLFGDGTLQEILDFVGGI